LKEEVGVRKELVKIGEGKREKESSAYDDIRKELYKSK